MVQLMALAFQHISFSRSKQTRYTVMCLLLYNIRFTIIVKVNRVSSELVLADPRNTTYEHCDFKTNHLEKFKLI